MTDPSILFVRPQAISADDKEALRAAGIVVVEVENPDDVKFVRASLEVSHSAMLEAAAVAISQSDMAKKAFGESMAQLITASHAFAAPKAEG